MNILLTLLQFNRNNTVTEIVEKTIYYSICEPFLRNLILCLNLLLLFFVVLKVPIVIS
jgi:hypothetical protein